MTKTKSKETKRIFAYVTKWISFLQKECPYFQTKEGLELLIWGAKHQVRGTLPQNQPRTKKLNRKERLQFYDPDDLKRLELFIKQTPASLQEQNLIQFYLMRDHGLSTNGLASMKVCGVKYDKSHCFVTYRQRGKPITIKLKPWLGELLVLFQQQYPRNDGWLWHRSPETKITTHANSHSIWNQFWGRESGYHTKMVKLGFLRKGLNGGSNIFPKNYQYGSLPEDIDIYKS